MKAETISVTKFNEYDLMSKKNKKKLFNFELY